MTGNIIKDGLAKGKKPLAIIFLERKFYVNLKEDPNEMNNIAGNDDYLELINKLIKKIQNWQERTGDKIKVELIGK